METRYTIGRLAKQTGYSSAMIRYFEREGLISSASRTSSGYRLFGPQHIEELKFVRKTQSLGFHAPQIKSIREIKESDALPTKKKEQLERILREHRQYAGEKAKYFANLVKELEEVTPESLLGLEA